MSRGGGGGGGGFSTYIEGGATYAGPSLQAPGIQA